MEVKDIKIDQELFSEVSKKGQSVKDTYKLYIHLRYIKYVEGVACFLMDAGDCHQDKALVLLSKKELRMLANTLFQLKTYGE